MWHTQKHGTQIPHNRPPLGPYLVWRTSSILLFNTERSVNLFEGEETTDDTLVGITVAQPYVQEQLH